MRFSRRPGHIEGLRMKPLCHGLAFSAAAILCQAPASAQQQGGWQVARVAEGGVAAYASQPPTVPAIIFRCERGVATMYVNIAGDPSAGPRVIGFVGSDTRTGVTETFTRDPQSRAWATQPGAATRALFLRDDFTVEVQLDGQTIASFWMQNARAAIGQALAGCPETGRSVPAPAPAPATAGSEAGDADLLRQARALFSDPRNGTAEPRFTPRLQAALDRINEAEMPMGWGNTLCECQETDNPRVVSARVARRDADVVQVDLDWGDFGRQRSFNILFRRANGRWAVDDILFAGGSDHSPAGTSLRAMGE